jgi:hypothetical protein
MIDPFAIYMAANAPTKIEHNEAEKLSDLIVMTMPNQNNIY